MNWVERYVNAVKLALPRPLREDAGDELYTFLEQKIVDAEQQQGASLSEATLIDLLRDHGHPLVVAASHQRRRTLIGEALFPFYKAALKWLALAVFLFYLAHIVLDNMLAEVWMPHRLVPDLVEIYLLVFAAVTLIFHFADRLLLSLDLLRDWNPRTLPPLIGAIPRTGPVIALVCIAAWITFLGAIEFDRSLPLLLGREGARIHTFVMWLQVHGLLTLLLYAWLLLRPWWNHQKLAARGAISLLLAAGAMRAQQLESATDFLVLGDRYIGTRAIDLLLWFVMLVALVESGYCLWRVVKAWRIAS